MKPETIIPDLTTEERRFAVNGWKSYVRTFDRHRASGNQKRAEANRQSIQRLMAEAASGKQYRSATV